MNSRRSSMKLTAKMKYTTRETNLIFFSDNCHKCGQLPTYADDSTIVIVTRNRFEAQNRIIVIVDRIKTFLDANSLSLNLGKTEILETMVRQKRIHLSGNPPQLSVTKPDGTLKVILAKDLCRLLGANINRDASWDTPG